MQRTRIINGLVFTENKEFLKQNITIENNQIINIENEPQIPDSLDGSTPNDDNIIDAKGLYVIPGLIDIHSHGACGYDFSDNSIEGLEKILKYEYDHGITSYCPTSMSLPKDELKEIYKGASNWKDSENHAKLAGLNMEGPFLDPLKKGVHKEENLSLPNINFINECNALSGNKIKLVTVAPNLPGANIFVQEISKSINVSLGHSMATYEEAQEAFNSGANHVTHLFNAMSPVNHREPGLILAAFDNKDCFVELICDGLHLHDSIVRMAFNMFRDRLVLISDSMRATGFGDGIYELGAQKVLVKNKKAVLLNNSISSNETTLSNNSTSNGEIILPKNSTASNAPFKETIAGSVCDLYDCMRMAIKIGIPFEDAVYASTIAPARSINIYDKVGSVSVGKASDLLLVDKDYNLVRVVS